MRSVVVLPHPLGPSRTSSSPSSTSKLTPSTAGALLPPNSFTRPRTLTARGPVSSADGLCADVVPFDSTTPVWRTYAAQGRLVNFWEYDAATSGSGTSQGSGESMQDSGSEGQAGVRVARRQVLGLLLSGAGVALLSACGGAATPAVPAAPTSPPPPPTSAPAATPAVAPTTAPTPAAARQLPLRPARPRLLRRLLYLHLWSASSRQRHKRLARSRAASCAWASSATLPRSTATTLGPRST